MNWAQRHNDSSLAVTIRCPRCQGFGRGNWRPDSGLCYRCKGARTVEIRPERHLRALLNLRAQYRRVRHEIETYKGALEGLEWLRKNLDSVVRDGLRVRGDLEAAGVPIPKG